MIPQVARYILKQAAGYSILAPLLLTSWTANKMIKLPDDASDLSRYGHAAALAVFLGLIGYNGFRFARPLYRGESPDLLRKAVNSASAILWLIPLMIMESGLSVLAWIPLWGAVCSLLGIFIQHLEPQIAAALAQESPEAKMAADAAD